MKPNFKSIFCVWALDRLDMKTMLVHVIESSTRGRHEIEATATKKNKTMTSVNHKGIS